MTITGVSAQATVRDLSSAEDWYRKLFDREPDARPMDGLLEWHFTGGQAVQVYAEPDRAGRSTVVLGVDDLDAFARRVRAVALTDAEPQDATSSRVLPIEDPDGNRIVVTGA
jgi:predicted enzyme related to lactoylglutathione lyase